MRAKIFWTIFLLQCSYCLSSVREKVITEVIVLQEGDEATLNCTTIRNIAKVFIYWEKDGEELTNFNDSDEFPIYHASCEYDGNYSCFTRDSSLAIAVLKKFVVKVSDNSGCPNPGEYGEDLIQKAEVCSVPSINDYPCCNNQVPSPGVVHLSHQISNKITDRCALGTMNNLKPWRIHVKWNLTQNGAWMLGWQVSLYGLDNFLNVRSCVQINSRNKLLNWTFDGLPFGGKYEIKVQVLPSDNKNYVAKYIVLPRKKALCKNIGRKRHWEICQVAVEDLYQKERSSIVRWRVSNLCKTQHTFEVYYRSDVNNCKDSGRIIVENATHIDLNITKCQSYYVEVRPVFSNSKEGTFSKSILFTPPQTVTPCPPPKSNVVITVACSIASGLLIAGLIAVILLKRKKENTSASLVRDEQEIVSIVANKTKVFIVHDDHCHLCRNVTHAFANVLNRTGYIECALDFCRMEEITSRGLGWYEHSIKDCDIIIVVCTKDGKKMYKEKRQDGPYIFILNMLLGQMIHHQNRSLQIIPIYFDISSHEDVPFFLSEYKCYSLPSQLQDLCSALCRDENASSGAAVCKSSTEMTQDISMLKGTIEIMRRNHEGYPRCKHKKYMVVVSMAT